MEMKAKVGFSCHWNQGVKLKWEQLLLLLLWNNTPTIYLCRWQRSKRHLWWEEWLARLLTQCRWWNCCSDYWDRTHESLGPNLRETQRFISHLFLLDIKSLCRSSSTYKGHSQEWFLSVKWGLKKTFQEDKHLTILTGSALIHILIHQFQ